MNSQSSTNPSQNAIAIGMLRAAWPKFTTEQARLYLLMTKDIPEPVLVKAIEALIKESPFLPTVAEIRSRAEALYKAAQGAEPPDAGRGWGEVVRESLAPGATASRRSRIPRRRRSSGGWGGRKSVPLRQMRPEYGGANL